jgi:phosphatidylinositol-3-phosphatase
MRSFVLLGVTALLAGCVGGSSPTAASTTSLTASSGAPASSSAAPSITGSSSPPRAGSSTPPTSFVPATGVPRFDHIVVVVEENRADAEVLGSTDAPYINQLARSGLLLTNSYAITHPSQPNYVALFSGSTQGLSSDGCPNTFSGDNLAHQLLSRHQSFAGYSQSLPSAGYLGCSAGPYARKHAPWTDFANVPRSAGRPLAQFPSYPDLPKVSFVIPDLNHDMHDGTIAEADAWLRSHLAGYVTWAESHNSLLVLTWDEDDRSAGNHIPTVLAGAHVPAAHYGKRVDHYTILRTIEAACGLPALGAAAHRAPITGVWSG